MWLAMWLACSSSVEAPKLDTPAAVEKAPSAEKTPAKPAEAKAGKASMEAYRKLATQLVTSIDEEAAPRKVTRDAERLTLLGVSLLEDVRAKHPACGPYFDAIIKVAPTLGDMPLDRIEKGFHSDGELPKSPDAACYHGKDLVVHPATVVALSKAGMDTPKGRLQAKREITEVLGHLTAVEH